MSAITLNMIVRDEEKLLPICLKAVRDFVDEITIVDTGSSDSTCALGKFYGAQVVDFTWVDDFALARNFALSLVKTPWVLWLDADDLILNPELIAPSLKEAQKHKANALWTLYKQDDACFQRRLHMFKTKEYQWEGVVHESPQPTNRNRSHSVFTDIVVLHRKPASRCPVAARRYLDILLRNDPENWLGIAESYKFLSVYPDDLEKLPEYQELADAHYWRAYLEPNTNDQTRYMCLFNCARINIERSAHDSKWFKMGLKQAQLGIAMYPDRAECWTLLGQCWHLMGMLWKAIECYETALSCELPLDDIGIVYQEWYSTVPRELLAKARASAAKMTPDEEITVWLPKQKGLILPH